MALLLTLVPFLLVEFVLRAVGVGAPKHDDPFVGFESARPLFVKVQDQYEISQDRLKFFALDRFSATKSPGEFRIFCLGGSTVQGRPYSIQTSFTTWLQLALEQADPSRTWDVINCGGISYASYRLLPILKECLRYEPDLIIVCTGHNEFLEDRTYSHIKNTPGWVRTLGRAARKSHVINTLRQVFVESSDVREQLPTEVDAILDYEEGLAAFHRNDEQANAIREHFEATLTAMKLHCERDRVPLVFVQPASNLVGTPPFKSSFERYARADSRAILDQAENLEQATLQLEAACSQSPRQALLWYELGQCYVYLGRYAEARSAFIRARDEDLCPLRMTSALESTLQRVAGESRFLNAHEILESQTESGILGDFWLVDHVHPSFSGHQLIALHLVQRLAHEGAVDLGAGWEQDARTAFELHFESLDATYFHRGQRMLAALKKWTQGRADGPHVQTRFPHLIPASR